MGLVGYDAHMSAVSISPSARVLRGQVAKQQAVLAAAFTVFAEVGYAQARIDDIAAEARVAKATVYNHYGDKQTLFRESVRELSDTALSANLAVVEQLAESEVDIAAILTSVGVQFVACHCRAESSGLRRLVAAEAGRFPELLDTVDQVSNRVLGALADRFARLSLAGVLGSLDPELAAVQFSALLTGPADLWFGLGHKPVSDEQALRIAEPAVATFLAAFGASSQ